MGTKKFNQWLAMPALALSFQLLTPDALNETPNADPLVPDSADEDAGGDDDDDGEIGWHKQVGFFKRHLENNDLFLHHLLYRIADYQTRLFKPSIGLTLEDSYDYAVLKKLGWFSLFGIGAQLEIPSRPDDVLERRKTNLDLEALTKIKLNELKHFQTALSSAFQPTQMRRVLFVQTRLLEICLLRIKNLVELYYSHHLFKG